MIQTISAAKIYQEQVDILNRKLSLRKKRQNLFGWSRLLLFFLTAIVGYNAFIYSILWGTLTILIAIVLFIILVSFDTDNNRFIRNIKSLIKINEEELLVLAEQYKNRFDGGSFASQMHDYANDLDIFGPSSLYQFINRCNSEQGRGLLAHNFLKPLSLQQILERQEAIKELSSQYEWRHQLAAYLLETPVTLSSQQKIETWIYEKDDLFMQKAWEWIVPIYSIVAIGIGLATLFGWISITAFSLFFIIFFIISGNFSRKANETYTLLNGITKEVAAMQEIIQWIEQKELKSSLLINLQHSVKSESALASLQIKRLQNILNRFDLRLNWFAFIFMNTFLLWDIRQVRGLNHWKQLNRDKVFSWFELIAQFEVLNSLAALYFNNPNWCWPSFSEHFIIKGENIGHPLIPISKRVTNDFQIQGYPKIAIITGSNMAGKSTFLRSLGVNVLLAQMGSPVCASHFVLSNVRLISSMRIEDNLAESTSTFYAELKKLKTVVDAVKSHEAVFVLLDEILRGTNSLDRHHGSKALIRQIIKEKGIAMIATHDVELAHMTKEFFHEIENYHFDVQVKGEELYFDYLLKNGICTNLNATILMKKIGIEL